MARNTDINVATEYPLNVGDWGGYLGAHPTTVPENLLVYPVGVDTRFMKRIRKRLGMELWGDLQSVKKVIVAETTGTKGATTSEITLGVSIADVASNHFVEIRSPTGSGIKGTYEVSSTSGMTITLESPWCGSGAAGAGSVIVYEYGHTSQNNDGGFGRSGIKPINFIEGFSFRERNTTSANSYKCGFVVGRPANLSVGGNVLVFKGGGTKSGDPLAIQPIRQYSRPTAALINGVGIKSVHYSVNTGFFFINITSNATNRPRGMVFWKNIDKHATTGSDNYWMFDWFGLPLQRAFYIAAGAPVAGGLSSAGNYILSARMIDPERFRRTNRLLHTLRSGKWDGTSTASPGSQVAGVPGINTIAADVAEEPNIAAGNKQYLPYVIGWDDISLAHSSGTSGSDDIHDRFFTHYEMISSISTGDVNNSAGPPYFVMEYYAARDAWIAGTVTTDEIKRTVASGNWMQDVARIVSGTGGNSGPYSDLAIAAQFEYSFEEDVFLEWDSFTRVCASAMYEGLSVLAVDDEGSVKLIWSSTTRYAPENFPFDNSYTTIIKSRYYDSSEWPYQYGNVALVPCGDFLYILGDGPAYRMRRVGSTVEIVKVNDHVPLLNKYAVCSLGNSLLVVTKSGIKIIDAASGSIVNVDALNEVISKRWFAGYKSEIHAVIQVAYDRLTDEVYIFNPFYSEAVVFNPTTKRIAWWSGLPFDYLREFDDLVDGNIAVRRAAFINGWGKICTPKFYLDDDVYPGQQPQYNNCGIRTTNTSQDRLTFTVKTASYSTDNIYGISHLRLELTNLDGTVFEMPGYQWSGTSIGFMTGPLAGKMYRLTYNRDHVGLPYVEIYHGNYPLMGVTAFTSDFLTSLIDSVVVLAPIPFMLAYGSLRDIGYATHNKAKTLEYVYYLMGDQYGWKTQYSEQKWPAFNWWGIGPEGFNSDATRPYVIGEPVHMAKPMPWPVEIDGLPFKPSPVDGSKNPGTPTNPSSSDVKANLTDLKSDATGSVVGGPRGVVLHPVVYGMQPNHIFDLLDVSAGVIIHNTMRL